MKIKKNLQKNLIVLCFNATVDSGCDYSIQTLKILEKTNYVIAYCLGEPITWKDFFSKRSGQKAIFQKYSHSILFHPFFFLPGQRFIFIKNINYYLNSIFLYLYLCFKYPHLKKILWFFEPFYLPIILSIFRTFCSVYDCIDYFSGFSKKATKNEQLILQQADFVFAHSQILTKLLCKSRKNVITVLAGFAETIFKNKRRGLLKRKKFPRQRLVVGYVGGIDIRLDYELLFQTAKQLPKVTFKLVGPVVKDVFGRKDDLETRLQKLLKLPNVLIFPPVPKIKIPKLIASFDVTIIPYDIHYKFNRYCFPMKLFEYFYMRKSVISTPIEALKPYQRLVKIANNAQEFVRHIKSLQQSGWPKNYQKEQRKLAIANSWEKKIEVINKLLMINC